MRVFVAIIGILAVVFLGLWFGFEPLVRSQTADSIDPPTGKLAVAGLTAPVSIRRDEYGVPLIEAQSAGDLAFATGYAMAQDRLGQMIGMSLSAQGRLAELVGEPALAMDIYMRTLDVRHIAEAHYEKLSPPLRTNLQRFADGVNSYVDTHRDRLPMSLRLSGYTPERWQPMDSMGIYVLLNLGLALNLHQEIGFLNLSAKVGPERAAWLMPTMPDEPLPLDEARKLEGANLAQLGNDARRLETLYAQLNDMLVPTGIAASNNWAIAPRNTAKGASILANDTHLLLEHPPMWMLMQLRSPDYNATGIAVAGVPGIVAGYNGHIAWGMTMVMADSQDLFVEQLKMQGKQMRYRVGQVWVPVQVREESFRVSGSSKPVTVIVRSTRHGPLIDDAIRAQPVNPLQAMPMNMPKDYGLALSWSVTEPDESMAALWELAAAKDMKQAQDAVRNIRYIHLNLVYADKDNIGWQVTGRYPKRNKGTGKFPSPGWYEDYDWNGWWDLNYQPAQVNPAAGFIGTANDRKVPANYPMSISQSWFYPERGERIDQMLAARRDHTWETSVAMQADQVNLFALKLKRVLLTDPFAAQLKAAMGKLPAEENLRAMEAYAALTGWDGNQRADSKDAAIFGLFQDALPRAAFLDELGPDEDSPAWRALLASSELAYSATQDHLLQRDNSPYWDDVGTAGVKETKADIVARALAAGIRDAEARMGTDRAQWQWGRVHTYTWRSPATEMRPHLSLLDRFLVGRLAPYTDRGPFPAGGDHNTLNVSGNKVGSGNLDVEVVPAMRMVVDFGDPEPVHLVIAGGQSGDPASPHYADGVALYLSMKNRAMPFNDEKARHAQYRDEFILEPAAQ